MSLIIGEPIINAVTSKAAELDKINADIAGIDDLQKSPLRILSYFEGEFVDDSEGVREEWRLKKLRLTEYRDIARQALSFLTAISMIETNGYSEAAFHTAVAANIAHVSAVRSRMLGVFERTGCYGDGGEDSEEASVMNDMLLLFIKTNTAPFA